MQKTASTKITLTFVSQVNKRQVAMCVSDENSTANSTTTTQLFTSSTYFLISYSSASELNIYLLIYLTCTFSSPSWKCLVYQNIPMPRPCFLIPS